jgi:NADPH2:quinone reductase
MEDVAPPICGPGQAAIRVAAAGVNFPDTLLVEGKYQRRPDPPFIPGAEVSGVIEEVGPGTEGLRSGDRVLALTSLGGFAERVVVDAVRITPIPTDMDFITAAGFGLTYCTSMHALRQRAEIREGQTLLVLGAGGGVGLTAVELGRIAGATVIAAASTDEKLRAARAAGANACVNYATESLRERVKSLTNGRGVDIIYDPVGGDLFNDALRCLAWNGRLLVVGFAGGHIPQIPANLLLLKGATVMGVFFGQFLQQEPEEYRRNFSQMFDWYREGKLKPLPNHIMPLAGAADALDALRNRSVVGKIVLSVNANGAAHD